MKKVLSTLTFLAPAVVLAQELDNIDKLVQSIGDIVNTLIPIVFALAILVFFWGLVKYILSAGDEEAKEKGRNIMIGGIIAIFVMAAIWGIVEFIASALDINTGGDFDVPTVNY